jgi:REP-associated tyrosine transposase
MIETYKDNMNVFSSCHSHVVWWPNYRRNMLVRAVETRFKNMIRQVYQKHQAVYRAAKNV